MQIIALCVNLYICPHNAFLDFIFLSTLSWFWLFGLLATSRNLWCIRKYSFNSLLARKLNDNSFLRLPYSYLKWDLFQGWITQSGSHGMAALKSRSLLAFKVVHSFFPLVMVNLFLVKKSIWIYLLSSLMEIFDMLKLFTMSYVGSGLRDIFVCSVLCYWYKEVCFYIFEANFLVWCQPDINGLCFGIWLYFLGGLRFIFSTSVLDNWTWNFFNFGFLKCDLWSLNALVEFWMSYSCIQKS